MTINRIVRTENLLERMSAKIQGASNAKQKAVGTASSAQTIPTDENGSVRKFTRWCPSRRKSKGTIRCRNRIKEARNSAIPIWNPSASLDGGVTPAFLE